MGENAGLLHASALLQFIVSIMYPRMARQRDSLRRMLLSVQTLDQAGR
jgi:hypothetical protein